MKNTKYRYIAIIFITLFILLFTKVIAINYVTKTVYKNTLKTEKLDSIEEEKFDDNDFHDNDEAIKIIEEKRNEDFWKEPTTSYPDLNIVKNLTITVNTNTQRVYLNDGEEILATFIVSTGLKDGISNTPLGDFEIQHERGSTFFSRSLKEGANYWVSFKGHGEYLFHSVPIDDKGDYILSEARKLGEPASHGCVRMSVPDSKWFYENIPIGTPIRIV